MAHIIRFANCENNWMNALPLGNGVLGAMAFYEDGILSLPMNHYEVYYNISDNVLPKDQLAQTPDFPDPGSWHREWVDLAAKTKAKENEAHCFYGKRSRNLPVNYVGVGLANSYPVTGELRFRFADALRNGKSDLSLHIEQARVEFSLEKDEKQLHMCIVVARQDCVLIQVTQSEPGLLSGVQWLHPVHRDRVPSDVCYTQRDDNTLSFVADVPLKSSVPDTPKQFRFAGAMRMKNGTFAARNDKEGLWADIKTQSARLELLTGIFTDWRYTELPDYAVMDSYMDTNALLREHADYWQDFHQRANICLPDKFLEKLWYANQYALDCCSGRDGIMKHHACGLNGLWAIRHPNLWGSMWYWDVNIQAAFAGVFSSNHLELGKVFSDGLLSYWELAKKYARNTHDLPGAAIDYPYFMYYCVFPWCAQYLWAYYEYTKDAAYLKEVYPMFLDLCEFAAALFQWDDRRGCYVVYPDISPEQGPLSHNTVITVSSVKYMLRFTLEAAGILQDADARLPQIQKLLENMPPYSLCEQGDLTPRFRDSEDAPDNLWIRHPSMLMPVFPIGEIDIESGERWRTIVDNTIDFLEKNCEIGVFQCSWISAAASRIGKGQKALRMLYERGIDHLLRSNGLTAEATDRFMNYCLINRQPLYYPCMMEFTGEMLAAVNEMLLQSHNHLIRIFPALPDGDPEYYRMLRAGHEVHEYKTRYAEYPAWKDVHFSNMLAKGGFEVSAQCKNGDVQWVTIHARVGGHARLTTPAGFAGYRVWCDDALVESSYQDGILSFETVAGKTYVVRQNADVQPISIPEQTDDGILEHLSYTKRRIAIGESQETLYHQRFDDFVRDWYLGNVRMENHVVYHFDITEKTDKKYLDFMPVQAYAAEPGRVTTATAFLPVNTEGFTAYRGYGFESSEGITICQQDGPDMLRQDFAEGTETVNFAVELPRGRYEALVISGCENAPTLTTIHSDNGYCAGGQLISAGCYQVEVIPMHHKRDGIARLQISTESGSKWRINGIFINMVKGYGNA